MAVFGSDPFPPDAPVLWFGPRAHANPGPRNSRLWLLWPTWAWRVAIPARPDGGLNLLQRTVLALAQAGVHTSAELGALMGLHPDLAHLVALELLHAGVLDTAGRPTGAGLRQLGDEDHAASPTAAWVFQDPFTGEIWPRAEAQMQYAETTHDGEGRVQLVLGDTDRPWYQRVLPVRPEGVAWPSPPDPRQVLVAARSHRKARRRMNREEDLDLYQDQDGYPTTSEAVSSWGVSFVEERAQPVWLAAYCYFPHGAERDDRWYAADPFGLAPSDRLRTAIQRRRDRFPPLRNALGRFLGERSEENEMASRELGIIEVEKRHGVGVRSHPSFEALVDVHTALAAGDRLTTLGARTAYTALRRALEEAALLLAEGAPWEDIHARDQAFNRQHLAYCASEAGLDPLPEPVLKVQRGQVRAAAQFRGGGLRPRLAAAVLRAAREENHPLRRAAMERPDIVLLVDSLADAAGNAVHRREFKLDQRQLSQDVGLLHEILVDLGLGPGRGTEEEGM